jgi:hypothetical protein
MTNMVSTPSTGKPFSQEIAKREEFSSQSGKKFKSVYEKTASKKKPFDEEEKPLVTPFELIQQMKGAKNASSEVKAFASLSIEPIFEEMVSQMSFLHENGIQQTTFTYDSKTSVLSGVQVVIKEFSTAPKSFNVELMGTPEAVVLLQKNVSDLVAAFNAEERPFKINRLETHLLNKKRKDVQKEERSRVNGPRSTLSLD